MRYNRRLYPDRVNLYQKGRASQDASKGRVDNPIPTHRGVVCNITLGMVVSLETSLAIEGWENRSIIVFPFDPELAAKDIIKELDAADDETGVGHVVEVCQRIDIQSMHRWRAICQTRT